MINSFGFSLCDSFNDAKFSFIRLDISLSLLASHTKELIFNIMFIYINCFGNLLYGLHNAKDQNSSWLLLPKICFSKRFFFNCFPVNVFLWSILIMYHKMPKIAGFVWPLTKRFCACWNSSCHFKQHCLNSWNVLLTSFHLAPS